MAMILISFIITTPPWLFHAWDQRCHPTLRQRKNMCKLLGEVAEVPVDRVSIPMSMFCIALLLSHLLTEILLFCTSALVKQKRLRWSLHVIFARKLGSLIALPRSILIAVAGASQNSKQWQHQSWSSAISAMVWVTTTELVQRSESGWPRNSRPKRLKIWRTLRVSPLCLLR